MCEKGNQLARRQQKEVTWQAYEQQANLKEHMSAFEATLDALRKSQPKEQQASRRDMDLALDAERGALQETHKIEIAQLLMQVLVCPFGWELV